MGKAGKTALFWEGFGGKEKHYTFNDIRLASNTIGQFLRDLGIREEDRVCLFMDRIPELYLSFLGVLKIGAIVQPLFSAFGDESLWVRLENAQTKTIITQRKHVSKVRKILDKMPFLEHIILVDHQSSKPLQDREVAFDQSADIQVVLQVLANARKIELHWDLVLPQMVGRSDSGKHQYMRRTDSTA